MSVSNWCWVNGKCDESHEGEVDLVYRKVSRFPCVLLVDFSGSSVSKCVQNIYRLVNPEHSNSFEIPSTSSLWVVCQRKGNNFLMTLVLRPLVRLLGGV